MDFKGYTAAEAGAFCARWLPAWTGNDPERLVAFYAGDAFYSDPARPGGMRGRDAILAYFQALLGRNPDWTWSHRRSDPLPGGFLNHWTATVPLGAGIRTVEGVCIVQFRDGLIVRNEVFFDRSPLAFAALPGEAGT